MIWVFYVFLWCAQVCAVDLAHCLKAYWHDHPESGEAYTQLAQDFADIRAREMDASCDAASLEESKKQYLRLKKVLELNALKGALKDVEGFAPGVTYTLSKKFLNACVGRLGHSGTQEGFAGFLQGFLGSINDSVRKEACSLSTEVFSGGLKEHAVYLLCNVANVVLFSTVLIAQAEQRESKKSVDLPALFEHLSQGRVFVDKDTQNIERLRAVERGVRGLQILLQIMRESEVPLPTTGVFCCDADWIPAGIDIQHILRDV